MWQILSVPNPDHTVASNEAINLAHMHHCYHVTPGGGGRKVDIPYLTLELLPSVSRTDIT